ncbi:MAG: MBL fold metallo-hydrolase [Thermoleophilia bacterium]|nr:MBL fold metallo-hydrolase [Thermoleophilia bacterium]
MAGLEVLGQTVGPVAENSYLVWIDGSDKAVLIDPGDEPDRLMEPLAERGLTLEAILLTHCHFDHIGAVAPVARATGAPVYCPELEVQILADIMAYVPWPGIGPYESYEADHLINGGDHLSIGGLEIDVLFTPGHSPGHVTFSIREHGAMFSGDVLFQNSVGRVDLPGGNWDTLLQSITMLVEAHPGETEVYPGHMGTTTLAAELATNPFLAEIPG